MRGVQCVYTAVRCLSQVCAHTRVCVRVCVCWCGSCGPIKHWAQQCPEFLQHQSEAYSASARHRSCGCRQVASSSWATAASLASGVTSAWKTPSPTLAHLLDTHLWSLSHLDPFAPAPASGRSASLHLLTAGTPTTERRVYLTIIL